MMPSIPRSVIITGITGQDGAYLTELLLSKGYKVYGTFRRTSSVNFWRIEELGIAQHPNLHLVEYDLTDLGSAIRLLQSTGATEVYNLAAQSFVGVSFDQPHTTAQITGVGALNCWKPFASSIPKFASTRPARRRCSARCRPFRRRKTHRFTPAAPTAWPSCMPTG